MPQATIASWDWYNEDSASPVTVNKPTGFTTGELLIGFLTQHAATSQAVIDAMTAPAGWQFEALYNEAQTQGKIWTHRWQNNDPATWNFGYDVGADICMAIIRVQGAETENPVLTVTSTNFAALATSDDSPSVTPKGVNDLLICFLVNICSGTLFVETDPTGMIDRGQTQAATTFHACAGASQTLTSSAATGVRTWTTVLPINQHGATLSVAVKSASDAWAAPFSGISPGPDGPTGQFTDTVYPGVPDIPSGNVNAAAQDANSTGTSPTAAVTISVNTDAPTGAGTANAAVPSVGAKPTAATGSGAAQSVTGTISPVVQAASGAGAAQTPAANIAPPGGLATGAGAAQAPGTAVSGTSGTATGSGTPGAPSAAISANPGAAASTGTAQTPGTTISGTSGTATGSGTPGTPSTSLLVNPATATGVGTALDATVTTAAATNAPATTATGTGGGQNPTTAVAPTPGVAATTGVAQTPAAGVAGTSGTATGSGTLGNPSPAVATGPTTAAGAGAAGNATVITGVFTNAAAQVANGVGVAATPNLAVAASSSGATGTGAAASATVTDGASGGVGAGAGAANGSTTLISSGSAVALATGTALNAQISVTITAQAGLASATATALGATANVSTTVELAGGVGQALNGTVEQEDDVHLYKFGPCEPWVPIWPRGDCASILLNTETAAVTGTAVQAASEVLYQLTAQRFGICSVKLRPCRKSCFGSFPWSTWWEYGTYPQPYWWNGTWYNLACGSCPDDTCSCVALDETILPGPVVDVTEVKINGTVLVRDVDYRLDDYRKLVRLGGALWPICQNMNLDDTKVDTWSVTADFGEVVPALGQLAVGELALEFVKAIMCEDCLLPAGVVDVSRQGVSMTISQVSDLYNKGFINLRFCDMLIQSTNPHHQQARSAVYDLDSPQGRAVGTW